MKIIIDYAGNRYETATTDEISAKAAKTSLSENLANINRLELTLKGGGYLILGPDAVGACAIQVLDT